MSEHEICCLPEGHQASRQPAAWPPWHSALADWGPTSPSQDTDLVDTRQTQKKRKSVRERQRERELLAVDRHHSFKFHNPASVLATIITNNVTQVCMVSVELNTLR